MKRIIYIIAAAFILMSCGDKNKGETELTLEQKMFGEWHSTSLAITADIYLSFTEDGKFELYQKIGDGAHRLYRGTWNLEENLLTGRYNDGEEWAAGYSVEISGRTLSLTSVNDAAEVSKFDRTEIPEEVKEGCVVEVKASGSCGSPVL